MKDFSFNIAFVETYKFMFNNIGLFFKTSIPVMLLYSLFEYKINEYIDYSTELGDNLYDIMPILMIGVLIQGVLIMMFVVPWGGYYLKHIKTIKLSDVVNWHHIKTDYLIANIKIMLIAFFGVLTILMTIGVLDVLVSKFLFIIPAILVLILCSRIIFILPSSIDGNKSSIRTAWEITKGNSLKITICYLAVMLPLMFIFIIFSVSLADSSSGYILSFFSTIITFISQSISTVYLINVYKQLAK